MPLLSLASCESHIYLQKFVLKQKQCMLLKSMLLIFNNNFII